MRLRRETGYFQIRVNPANGTNALRTGLSAEDFAGELVDINGTIEPVLSVNENDGVVTAKTASYTVTYNKETGAVTSSEGGAGGSGGGSASRLAIECGYGYVEAIDGDGFIFDGPIATGISPQEMMNAVLIVTNASGHGPQSTTMLSISLVAENWSTESRFENVYYVTASYGSHSPGSYVNPSGTDFYYNSVTGAISVNAGAVVNS